MAHQRANPAATAAQAPPARLEPDAIGVAQDTVIGMASSAPAASVGLTLAALGRCHRLRQRAGHRAHALPMLIIANAYRRLNMWNANCGASLRVGRPRHQPLPGVPDRLADDRRLHHRDGQRRGSPRPLRPGRLRHRCHGRRLAGHRHRDRGDGLVMLVIAVAGIRITARAQVAMAVIEYAILIGFAVAGLALVPGSPPRHLPDQPRAGSA